MSSSWDPGGRIEQHGLRAIHLLALVLRVDRRAVCQVLGGTSLRLRCDGGDKDAPELPAAGSAIQHDGIRPLT